MYVLMVHSAIILYYWLIIESMRFMGKKWKVRSYVQPIRLQADRLSPKYYYKSEDSLF